MKPLSVTRFLFVFLTIFSFIAPVCAAEEKSASYTLTKVRLLPKAGTESALLGGKILGSQEGATTAMEVLAEVMEIPEQGRWLEIVVAPTKPYRYIKFAAASDTAVCVAEIEFYSETGKLTGEFFGTAVAQGKSDVSFEKAVDGDPATWFEFQDANGYVGLILEGHAQAPRPDFSPSGGAYVEPQEIVIGTWNSDVVIRYTIDGSIPDENSPIFEKPIHVMQNTTLAARAFLTDRADSDVVLASYRIGHDTVNLPEVFTYHIGNSLTDTVNGVLQEIADSAGKNLSFVRKTIPGAGIQLNYESGWGGFTNREDWMNDFRRVFKEKKVDHLFLQPFPNPPGIVSDAEYGGKFIQLCRENNPDVQPWLYAQWPAQRWYGDAHCQGAGWMTPPWFPPNREPADWEEAMANKMLYYHEVLDRWNELPGQKSLKIVPGGPGLVLLKRAIEAGDIPGLDSFFPVIFADDVHLSRQGRYFVSLVHYGCIFRESPEGKVTHANSGLTSEQACIFQQIAWKTVLAEPLSGVAGEEP